MTHKLSITLVKTVIEPQYVIQGNQIWFNINCDGCTSSATTPSVPMNVESTFNSPCEFIISTPDTMQSYIYITLCYFGSSPDQMIPLARARSRIGKLPINSGSPQSFQIPLISAADKTTRVASATFMGTILPLSQPGRATYTGQVPAPGYPQPAPSYPYNQGMMGAVPQGPPQAYPLPGRASMNLPPGHSGYGGMQGQFPGAPGSAGMQPAPYTPPGSGPGMTPMGYPAAPPQMGYPPNQGMNPYGVPPNAQPGAPPPGPNQSPYGAPQQPQGQNTPGYTQATAGGNQYYF